MNCWTPVRLCRMPSSVEVCFFVSFDMEGKNGDLAVVFWK
jgi:hypothetical protein